MKYSVRVMKVGSGHRRQETVLTLKVRLEHCVLNKILKTIGNTKEKMRNNVRELGPQDFTLKGV